MKITLGPVIHDLRRLLRLDIQSPSHCADESWNVSESSSHLEKKSYFLPGQFEKITRLSIFSTSFERELENAVGGRVVECPSPIAHVIRNVFLIDGTLYKGSYSDALHPRVRRIPRLGATQEFKRAALHCTYGGNKYFGAWIMDDCLTYALAEKHGDPIVTKLPMKTAQQMQYRGLMGHKSMEVDAAFIEEAVVFEDTFNNQDRRARMDRLRKHLLGNKPAASHPGVFILRGSSGELRYLANEMELAQQLARTRGLRIVDPAQLSAKEMVDLCAGSRLVAGVEGSQLANGKLMMEAGTSMLTIQPPDRFCSVFKDWTDRDDQYFGFVVGTQSGKGFHIDPAEVERTLDLMPLS